MADHQQVSVHDEDVPGEYELVTGALLAGTKYRSEEHSLNSSHVF